MYIPGSETLPMGLMLIVGALLAIAIAALIGIAVVRRRHHPPLGPNTEGPVEPPPVADEPLRTVRDGASRPR